MAKCEQSVHPKRSLLKFQRRRLDPTTEGDNKETINFGYIGYTSPTTPPLPTQPIPLTLQDHTAFLAQFQQESFELCQFLLESFAIALDVGLYSALEQWHRLIYCVTARTGLLHVSAYERRRNGVNPSIITLPSNRPRSSFLDEPRRCAFRLWLTHCTFPHSSYPFFSDCVK